MSHLAIATFGSFAAVQSKRMGRCLPTLLAATMLSSLPLGTGVAQAQEASAEAATQTFAIPAQPLNDALVAFTDATGIRFFVEASLTRGKRSPGVRGSASLWTG